MDPYICVYVQFVTRNLPDCNERALLQIAGLGEKRVTILANSEAPEVYEELVVAFPKLSNAGGFELMRVPEGGSKQLEVIAAPETGYTVSYLKAVIHHAKIYIRPLQRDLCLEPVKETVRNTLRYWYVLILNTVI